MLYHQPHIMENRGTLIDEDILDIKLNAKFPSNSPNDRMFKTANSLLALL